MLLCAMLAAALMFADARFTRMEPVRAQLSTLVAPIQWVVSLPSDVLNWGRWHSPSSAPWSTRTAGSASRS